MKLETIFFDLGNTLLFNRYLNVDSIQTACHRSAEAFVSLGYRIREKDLAATHFYNLHRYYAFRDSDYIEQSAEVIFIQTLEAFGFTDVPIDHIRIAIGAFYTYTQSNWHLVPGVIAMMTTLHERNLRIGLISNASSTEDVMTLLETHGLTNYLDTITVSAEVGIRKPRIEIFEIAMQRTKARPQTSLMVGDTFIADILGAKEAGMRAVWATQYAKPGQAVPPGVRPDLELDEITRLPHVLDTLESRDIALNN